MGYNAARREGSMGRAGVDGVDDMDGVWQERKLYQWPLSIRHSWSHSGQAVFMSLVYFSMHSPHSRSMLGTSPYFALISSGDRTVRPEQPHFGQDDLIV